jgi:hypothetical protein
MSTTLAQRPQGTMRPARRPAPVRHRPARRRATLRARRLAASLAVVTLVCLTVWGALALHSEASVDPATVSATVVVGPGDTIWDIAEEYLPAGQSTHAYVARVLRHNGVDAAAVRPGAVLQLPRD